jgi:hypothetical protein
MQNKVIKIMYKFPVRKHTVEVYRETKKFNVISLNVIALCILMYTINNNLVKNEFEITINNDIHNHFTRQASHIHIEFRRTNIGKNSIITKAAHLYNELPNQIKEAQNINIFKKLLRTHELNIQVKNDK